MARDAVRLGKYILQKQLGKGGMGVVYLAVQEGLDRHVALKVLQESRIGNRADLLKRFIKEVSVCARLSHPNIVKVFDYGAERGCYYYAMELLDAVTLEAKVKQQGALPLAEVFSIGRDLIEAFRHYFPLGIVHRDLKLANIMIDRDGKAIVTDFGLVKDLLASDITQHGVAVGTPYFMSPEMVTARQVGPQSDVFQFGVVMYCMLTGRVPFRGSQTAEVFQAVLHGEPPAPSSVNPAVPPALDVLVANCMRKLPAERYPDADSLGADLERAAAGRTVEPLPSLSDRLLPGPELDDAAEPERPTASSRMGTAERQQQPAHGPSRPRAPGGDAAATYASRLDEDATAGEMGPGTVEHDGEPPPRSPDRGRTAPKTDRLPPPLDGLGATPRPFDKLRARGEREIGRPRRRRTVAVALACALGIPAVAWVAFSLRQTAPAFAVMEMKTRVAATRAAFAWSSPGPYVDRIVWALEGDEHWKFAESDRPAATAHAIVLQELQPATSYRFRVFYPDGTRSLEYPFRTLEADVVPIGLKRVGPHWELAFSTPHAARIELRHGAQAVMDPVPSEEHRLLLSSFEPATERLGLSFDDAAGGLRTLDHEAIVEGLRAAVLPKLAAELPRELAGFDPGPMLYERIDKRLPRRLVPVERDRLDIGPLNDALTDSGVDYGDSPNYYGRFEPGDPVAGALAADLALELEARPFWPRLEVLRKLGEGLLEGSRLGIEAELALLGGLRRLRHVDLYARALGIPFSTGVDRLFGEEYVQRTAPSLPAESLLASEQMRGQQAFAVPWRDFDITRGNFFGAGPDRLGPSSWAFEAPTEGTFASAELVLAGAFVFREHRLAVTLNDTLALDFVNPAPERARGQERRSETLAVRFDPRAMRRGKNTVRVEALPLEGTRDLGVKNAWLQGVRVLAR